MAPSDFLNKTTKKAAILALSLAQLYLSGCAARYTVKSFPDGATVFVRDVVTQEKKLVGTTPLTVKKTKEMGEVFFLIVEKDNFFGKQVLMTPRDGENLTVSVNLEPVQDAKNVAGNKGDEKGNPPPPPDPKKKEDDLAMRIALLENTVSMYKDALFSGRYSGGPAPSDRARTDDIVDNLFKAQQLVMSKKYTEALEEVDKALTQDEYLPQAHLIKGTIFYVNKDYERARIAWERCLKVDPYNAQAYQYLRLVAKKTGGTMPPDRPSYLRAPATQEFSRSLRK